MQDFYPAILKFAIVAALALLFIAVTFIPQQEATQVMGDNMDEALSSVKEIIEETATYSGTQVVDYIETHCLPGNTTVVKVKIGGTTYTFLEDDIPTGETSDADALITDSDEFERKRTAIDEITFTRK